VTRRLIACLVWLSVAAAAASDPVRSEIPKDDPPSIELERAVYAAGKVVVDFHVNNAITPETLELIHSGIGVKFRHRIEIRGERRFWLSPRRVLARVVVDSGVEFDALTGRYSLTRVTTLREPHSKKAPPPRTESAVTDRTEVMIAWMTDGRQIELYDPLGALPKQPMRVSVESSIGLQYVLLFFPTQQTVDAFGSVTD
jgi:hypothetical protein